jgi:hypothetical protein
MLLSQTETLVNAKPTIFNARRMHQFQPENVHPAFELRFFVWDKPAGSWLGTRLGYLRGVDQFPDLKKPRFVASGHPASAVTPFGLLAGIWPGPLRLFVSAAGALPKD